MGTLAREFYDNDIIHKVLIFPNHVYKIFPERFPNSRVTNEITDEDIAWLFEGVDKLLFFETPFRWDIIEKAKKRGIKTIIMPMHEGLPDPPPINPDLWICPSSLEMELPIEPKVFIPIPVNTDRIKWRKREKAKVFVHNAGHGGISMRNGSLEVVQAMKYVQSDIKLIIRTQYHQFVSDDPRIEVRYMNVLDYWDLWREGDVFLFPEKFNGLSLPIQEAVASGMMVMATDRRPFNQWLPKEPLIKPSGFNKTTIARPIESARIEPRVIADKIEEFANRDISFYSEWGREWAKHHSWEALRSMYLNL